MTQPSSFFSASNAYLHNYDQRNFATATSLFRGLPDFQAQPLLFGQMPQHTGRFQSATALSQYSDEVSRRASAPSHLPVQRVPGVTSEPRPLTATQASQQQQFQPPQIQATASQPQTRAPIALYLQCDDDSLTPYQCLARQQIQLFEATLADADAGTQGRNRSIVVGQVGIRCRHCGHLPLRERARGSTYYPSKLAGIYQAAQNMANSHLTQYCREIPKDIREELKSLGNKKSSAGGGKGYWSGGAKILGVIEDEHGLRFGK